MIITLCILSVMCGLVVGYYFRNQHRHVALIWNGQYAKLVKCKPHAAGVQSGGTVYPSSWKETLMYNGKSTSTGVTVYLCAVEPVPLLNHETMETYRSSIDFMSVFKPHNQIIEYLQMASAVIAFALVLWMAMSFGRVATITEQMALNQNQFIQRLDSFEERLNQPLRVEQE